MYTDERTSLQSKATLEPIISTQHKEKLMLVAVSVLVITTVPKI